MENSKNITCQEFIEFLNEYIDDEMPSDRKQIFEDHVTHCEHCNAYLDSYKKTIKMTIDSINSTSIPDKVPAELIDAILATRKQ